MKKFFITLIILQSIGNTFAQSTLPEILNQRLNYYNSILPYEKVYIQCDRPMYKPGDDMLLSLL